MTIKKWSLCSDDTKTNAYNAKLFEYITRDNKYYINNFKQTQQKIIAVNYYILSVIKEKINDYPEEQQDKDNRFLQKVSLLHDQSRLSYKNNKGQYLWSVNWSYFRKEGRSNRMCAIFIWFLFFSLYSSAIGLIVYSYYYDGITLPLTLFLLLEMVNIIFIIIHRRILVLSCRLLPNINYPYNSKVEMLWNALDISYISQNEMIRRIRIVYNIMFVRSLSVHTLYTMNSVTLNEDMIKIIADYLWFPLPYSLEMQHESIDMTKKYEMLPSTEMIQNTDIDPDYLSFIFDDESDGDDDKINIEGKRLIASDIEDNGLEIHFMETRL